MQTRWIILFVLFFARTTMAFQFQSIAALSPYIVESLALRLLDIGLLIGLYLGPGVIVATLGGTVGTWFGDKRTVVASLGLMVLGSFAVAFAPGFGWVAAGRVISGIGGVVINVLMTKMVLDWFIGHRVSTALGIFISSWPLGIALSLLVLPLLADLGGLAMAWNGLILLTVVALLLYSIIYRSPDGSKPAPAKITFSALPWASLIQAAMLWGLYNAAFAMLFGFGPLVLLDRGLSTSAASSLTSLYMIFGAVGIPVGGWLADRTARPYVVISVSLFSGIVLFPVVLIAPLWSLAPLLCFGGFLIGLAPGPIVAMPGQILPEASRAFGTGVFYSIYYALMMVAPPLAGAVADALGAVDVAFLIGAVFMAAAVLSLSLFRTLRMRESAV
ncbi:CynX/NimT family MFS transporter [Marimonas sp. MJW-29]|uniref:CynX/NimT family MFS transporter n=1 Tax=Sulfitobacter sediminis TaxID=3234186 RepID=A0ABV3RLQ1_9RHOB